MNDRGFTIKKTKELPIYFIYIVLLYVLVIFVFPNITAKEFTAYNYIVNIDMAKMCFTFLLNMIILIIVNKYYRLMNTFSEHVILLLILFYFLPGTVMAGVLNFEWIYIIEYYLYFLAIVFFDRIIGYPKMGFRPFTNKNIRFLRGAIILFSLVLPLFLVRVFGKSLSIAELITTLNDPYGVRNASKELNVSWIIIAFEYWACYFSFLMVTYYLKRKKYWLAILFILSGLFYFILQGNRIFFFFLLISIILGLFRFNKDFVKYVFVGILIIQIIEFLLLSHGELGMITNVFRRYSLVPNLISTNYFDYFSNNVPDWLRGTYTGIAGLLGLESPYGYEINYTIGTLYYGFRMYANNGMFGGAFFEFGTLGIVIDTFMFVIFIRLIEKIFYYVDNNLRFMYAVIFSSLSINTPVMWTGCIKFSYTSLLLITFFLFFDEKNKILFETHNDNGIS